MALVWLWYGFGVALVWLSVGYHMALGGFGWLCRHREDLGRLHTFFGFCVHLRRSCPSMRRGFIMVYESLPFAVGQETLQSEQRATRTALPPEARWSCQQGRASGPVIGSLANMNLTNYDSN
jgi:hypothetical protein